jgi:hypothetical protein
LGVQLGLSVFQFMVHHRKFCCALQNPNLQIVARSGEQSFRPAT